VSASRKRETKETSIQVFLETEGSGIIQVDTGIELLDEILSAIARGAGFDLAGIALGLGPEELGLFMNSVSPMAMMERIKII